MDGVCAVQTFKNSYSGYMLYLFAKYYLSLNFTVIIYDRYGAHEQFLSSLFSSPHLMYYNYTVLSLLFPAIYNASEVLKRPGATSYKVYYNRESNYESDSRLVRCLLP